MITEDAVRARVEELVPSSWSAAVEDLLVDPDEILVVLRLPDDPDPRRAAHAFRQRSRDARVRIAEVLQDSFDRKVSWGVACADVRVLFTHLSLPVMTRLRVPERRVLDTLIDAGVARSRSDALAWCVRLVGHHEQIWLDELRAAFRAVERVRTEGPRSGR